MKNNVHFFVIPPLLVVLMILSACIEIDHVAPLATLEPGNLLDIKNVVVSKPNEQEIGQLPKVDELPADACSINKQVTTCSLVANQAIKWGWGLCKSEKDALTTAVSDTHVELIVDGVRIPEEYIYHHENIADRRLFQYCHSWYTKLSDWQTGSIVKLENRNVGRGFPPEKTIVIINVD